MTENTLKTLDSHPETMHPTATKTVAKTPSRFKFTQKLIEQLPPHPKESKSTEAEYTDTEVAGLKLLVSKSGRKFYYFRYTFNGQKRAIKLGEHGALSVAEARKLALERRHQLDQGIDPQAEKAAKTAMPTLAEFALQEYLPYAEQHKRSANSDESKLRIHILPRFGTRKLDDISLRDIQQYHAEIKRLCSPATANRHLSLWSKLFKLAMQWERIEKNPCQGIRKFQENNQRDRFLSQDEIQRMFQAMESEPNQVIVAALKFLLLTGVRKEEALKAKWENVNLERGTLFLPDTKSGKSRSVVLNPEAIALLQEQVRLPDNPYVFPGKVKGQALNNPIKGFHRILAAAGIENLRIHDLRHSFASLAVNSGATLYDVQHLLGHASPQTTQRYAHLADERLRKVSGAVGEVVGQVTPSSDRS
ncbi:integrase family protein [Thiorhodococcus drewsii AZ1]|uniref:Integrase family protein n=1 Tax=Thiorhodococcus drewsii AZ1 TaxID=765913 RepID=G2E7V3_9GAMM|nr:site-specific integrase [Thiorhodococcus drewsii]EGV27828.1 integrase family protein [Thiorhodococcus drewsii AZ1]